MVFNGCFNSVYLGMLYQLFHQRENVEDAFSGMEYLTEWKKAIVNVIVSPVSKYS